jgi:hypothetical protein
LIFKEFICHGSADYAAGKASGKIFAMEEKTMVNELGLLKSSPRHFTLGKASLHVTAIPEKLVSS